MLDGASRGSARSVSRFERIQEAKIHSRFDRLHCERHPEFQRPFMIEIGALA
jgi:hypothetical protein